MCSSAGPKKHCDILGSNVISCNLFYDRTCPMRVPTSPHRFSENVVSNRLYRSSFLSLCSMLRRILVLLSNIRISNKMLPKFEILDTKSLSMYFESSASFWILTNTYISIQNLGMSNHSGIWTISTAFINSVRCNFADYCPDRCLFISGINNGSIMYFPLSSEVHNYSSLLKSDTLKGVR
jgi:hypothetical protein